MFVLPFYSLSKNAAICCSFVRVRIVLMASVSGLELASVMRRTISNHDLGRVLVRHDDRWLR